MRGADYFKLLALVVLLLSACATPSRAPVTDRSSADRSATTYRVRSGDTLYSIAWRHGLDYRALATRNGIAKPYVIRPGQVLQLRVARVVAAKPRAAGPALPLRHWRWPAAGPITRTFGQGNKGVDVAVTRGTAIGVVSGGEVVYAGGGLRGYRSLVIVKHDARWLSAYSFNQPSRVREGQVVKAGAPLADIEGDGSAAVLHFEIRKDGDPVDPRQVIPTSR
jgi:lipoprotein NlpD